MLGEVWYEEMWYGRGNTGQGAQAVEVLRSKIRVSAGVWSPSLGGYMQQFSELYFLFDWMLQVYFLAVD